MTTNDRVYRFKCLTEACSHVPAFAVLMRRTDTGPQYLLSWLCHEHRHTIEGVDAFEVQRVEWPAVRLEGQTLHVATVRIQSTEPFEYAPVTPIKPEGLVQCDPTELVEALKADVAAKDEL